MAAKKLTVVTSALPYANGPIHIGHLVEYIQTDIFVRLLKLIGENAVYCCADDTHGTPIEIKAKSLGIAPEELIAKTYNEHTRDFAKFHIHFDSYYSTNSEENRHFSETIFLRAKKAGFIYQKEIEQTYCETCKRVLPDRFVKGKCPKCGAEDQYGDVCESCNAAYKTIDLAGPYCTVCKGTPVRKKSTHYFFNLSAFSDKLKDWLTNSKIQDDVKNFALSWIRGGLEDWDITRDGPYFGFKIPGEENKYFYVWLDAPVGYIASLSNYLGKDIAKTEQTWNSSKIIHFIGKDITYFHLLFWPATLMAADFSLPDDIIVHGFLTVKKTKMSKSRGTLLTAEDYWKKLNPEYLRFYYASSLSHNTSDIDFNFGELKDKANNELVANIANFTYRVLSFANRLFDSKVGSTIDPEFAKLFNFDKVKEHYLSYNFRDVVKAILEISSIGNKYFQDNEPWKLIKEDREKAHIVVSSAVNAVKNLCILVKPILPDFAAKLESQLNLKNLTWKDLNFNLKNHTINKAEIILQKLEDKDNIFEEKDNAFAKLNLRVAKVLEVKDHPNADNLYILQLDLGAEKRQIVAGVRKNHTKEELLGKNIVVVTNLKPAKLRGVESNGMLLAACSPDESIIKVVQPNKSRPGDQVYVDKSTKPGTQQIEIDEFGQLELKTKNKKVVFAEQPLRTDAEELSVDVCDGYKVR